MSKVDEAIVEIDAALAEMAPAHEGLRDYQRLNIKPETKAAVDAAIAQYDRRKDLLLGAKTNLERLVGDGYPTLDIPDVSVVVKEDLDEQKRTIDAALAQFSSVPPATDLGLSAGAPEPK